MNNLITIGLDRIVKYWSYNNRRYKYIYIYINLLIFREFSLVW